MPTSCSVIGCKSRANAGPKKQFFRFPQKRPKVLQQWLMVLDRLDWSPKPSSKICSDHFSPEDFLYRPNVSIPRLKPEAVPSIFPDPSTAQDEEIEVPVDENKDSKVPLKIKSCDTQNQENLNENSVKGDCNKQAEDNDAFPKRPRRTSKINVKMKDFILLDDLRKLNKPNPLEVQKKSLEKSGEELSIKPKSPEILKSSDEIKPNEKHDTPPKSITAREVDAAKELLSILADSDDESSDPSPNKNDGVSNNGQISSLLSSSPENGSFIGKVQLKHDSDKVCNIKKLHSGSKLSKKILHSGVNIVEIASKVKAATFPIRFASGRTEIGRTVESKTFKQKTKAVTVLDGKNVSAAKVHQQVTKTKGPDTSEHHNSPDDQSNVNINDIQSDGKIPMRMRTKRPSTDLAKTYFPIRCGENYFYFSYADLNPIVDLSKNNVLIENSSDKVEEDSVSTNKSKSQTKRKLKRRIEESPSVSESKIDEIVEHTEENTSQLPEIEKVSVSANENNDETSTEVDEASESNEASNVDLPNSNENNVTLLNDQAESVSDIGNSSDNVHVDDNTTEFENSESLPSPAKKRRKRFKTVAEIVVRTDNTKPGEIPNVSIDKINKIVDFKATKSPVAKNLRKANKSTNEATNSVDFNDNLSQITLSTDVESSDEELARLAERITDTVKRMKLLDRVKGNASKLTVLITTLPPVTEKEILIIKKKNVETNNIIQSRELQVVISSNKVNESSIHGNILVTNPIGYTILPAGKNMSSKSLNDLSSNNSEEHDVNLDQEHPTIVCFQDRSGNKESSEINSVSGENAELSEMANESHIESEDNENNSSEAIIHDHPYISPNVKYLLANPNVSINLSEVQSKETSSKMKLSENEIIFRNKVSKKLRSLKENIQKKNDAINKLKDKIRYLERNLKEVKRNRKNPLKTMKKESASLLKNDIFYGVEQLVDTSDFSNTMDYSLNNIELPLGLDENGEESDDDGERECASPITYLCEPAIEVPSKEREMGN